MIEITQERADQLVKMFKYLMSRGYKLDYRDNSFRIENGIQYIVQPCSYQLITLNDKQNKLLAKLSQDKGIFTYQEF